MVSDLRSHCFVRSAPFLWTLQSVVSEFGTFEGLMHVLATYMRILDLSLLQYRLYDLVLI